MIEENNDFINKMIAYETGEMSKEEEILSFLQEVYDKGIAFSLQGHYSRTIVALLNTGKLKKHV